MTPSHSANHLAAKLESKPQKQRSLKAEILQTQISLETQNLQVQATILAFSNMKEHFSLPMGAFKIHRHVKRNHGYSDIGQSGTFVTSTPAMRSNARFVHGCDPLMTRASIWTLA